MSSSSGDSAFPRLFATIDYPTDKVSLLHRAIELDAPGSLCDAIRRLPDGPLRSREELVAAIEAISG
jgi:hypothetical protein